MIELFDPARLLPRRDRSLRLAGVAAALGAAGVAAHAGLLVHQLNQRQAEHTALRADFTRQNKIAAANAPATSALLADLRTQAERLEGEVASASGSGGGAGSTFGLTPVQWLDRLDILSGPDVSLDRVDIDRAGSARLEGLARTPSALSGYVQAWDRLPDLAPVRARTIEVRQDVHAAPALRFELRAAAATAATASAASASRRAQP